MSETQNTEYKSSRRDEYLKRICGFANANGGILFIGKDDNGDIVGLENAKKLMEEIPNKVRDILWIVVDVNLHATDKKDFIEIIVAPHSNPVNYKGQYHYRSGSTKQELKGSALDKFLLQKQGKRRDGVGIPRVSITDLKPETFDFFRKKALKSWRIDEESLAESDEQLIHNLQLNEDEYLKRACILLFHPFPEKFITGSFIKIGAFGKDDSDLLFRDEIHGNLFEQVEKTMDLLFTKYIKANISYEGITRVETYEYPREAVREALLNAVVHKDYSGLTPIQISVYPEKLMIRNEAQLPDQRTIETLLSKHISKPYNPDIANAFFRCGYIELWGRGFNKMIKLCKETGQPLPLYYYKTSGVWVEFRKDKYNADELRKLWLNERQIQAVEYVREHGKITNGEYQKLNDTIAKTAFRDLDELLELQIFNKLWDNRWTYYKLKNVR